MNITRSDSHIPSAPAASMNQFQIPKGQNPLRLPFASFRLIFGLEKTVSHILIVDADLKLTGDSRPAGSTVLK